MNQPTGSPAAGSQEAPLADDERLRQDLHATLGARQELGPRYEAELIESFLRRLDQSMDARIEEHLSHRLPASAGQPEPVHPSHDDPAKRIAVSLGISIPLIAIAGGLAGLPGILGVLALVGFLNVYYDRQQR